MIAKNMKLAALLLSLVVASAQAAESKEKEVVTPVATPVVVAEVKRAPVAKVSKVAAVKKTLSTSFTSAKASLSSAKTTVANAVWYNRTRKQLIIAGVSVATIAGIAAYFASASSDEDTEESFS